MHTSFNTFDAGVTAVPVFFCFFFNYFHFFFFYYYYLGCDSDVTYADPVLYSLFTFRAGATNALIFIDLTRKFLFLFFLQKSHGENTSDFFQRKCRQKIGYPRRRYFGRFKFFWTFSAAIQTNLSIEQNDFLNFQSKNTISYPLGSTALVLLETISF